MRGNFLSFFYFLVIITSLAAAEVSFSCSTNNIVFYEFDDCKNELVETQMTDFNFEDLCGFNPPDEWWQDANFYFLKTTADGPPSSFDWRDHGGVTPVQNQGSCGSCWAFGTVAPLESAILIKEGITVDLSEQWLVSCNRDGWDCGGGWWAHDYHQWKTGECGGFGAVFENDFPYSGSNEPCYGPYDHPYILEDWAYVGSQGSVPSTNAIKQAILDYGPVSAAVKASSGWDNYDGSYVYNDHAYGSVNHAVTIVGWDDSMGSDGAWIIKNSWGTNWGDNGYMYIEYGCSSIGYSACFVNGYRGPPTDAEEKITFTIKEITNDPDRGDFERIEPIFNKPEWYYRVGLQVSGESKEQYNYNMWTESLGNFGYNSEYTWGAQEEHIFYTNQPTVDVTIKLMENDELTEWGLLFKDDLADVSAKPGGGVQDGADQEKRAAIYHGTYNLITGEITGDETSSPDSQGYHTTMGDGNENAKVWFKITDTYNEQLYEPQMQVNPDIIDDWEKEDGETVATFTIKNLAEHDENAWQLLEWTATDNKNWISLDVTSGSIQGNSETTVTVTVDTEDLSKGTHTGKITIESNDEDKEIDVEIKIKEKGKNIPFIKTFQWDLISSIIQIIKTILILN